MLGFELPDIEEMWDYGNPAGTEARFREVLAVAGDDEAYRLELLTQLARTLGLQRQFGEAHQILDGVEPHLATGSARLRVRYFLERGRVFNSSGKKAEASVAFLRAWEVAVPAGEDGLAVDAAHMLGISEPPEKRMGWHLQALALAERSDQPQAQKWQGSLYNNIGWTYHDEGAYERALAMFEKGVVFREAEGKVDLIRIAHWCVGRCLRSLGRVAEALAKQSALLAEYEAANEPSGYTWEEMGECLLALHRPGEAQPYFALAYGALSQDGWLVAEEPERLARLKEIGDW